MHMICLKKALNDLLSNKSRSVLVLVAMIIGIVGAGSVLNARAILIREMDENYMRTDPASATLLLQNPDKGIMKKAEELPGIKDVEARRSLMGRVRTEDGLGTSILIFIIEDFNSMKNSTFSSEKGEWPPASGEMLIEREALSLVKADIGDSIDVRIPGYPAVEMKISGTVHAPALAPAWMEDMAYGFISGETYEVIGGKDGLNEFKFVVTENPMNKDHITDIAYSMKDWFEKNGVQVMRVEIPKPGKHPHATQMETLLFLLEAFGLLTFILSAIIVANMISSLLSGQIRQIGMMKAVGGKTEQVALIYLFMVLILGIISLVVSVPAAVMAGRAYSLFCADILNFTIFNSAIPIEIILVQVGLALMLPLFAAAYPIIKGTWVTVREALQDYGIKSGKAGQGRMEVHLSRFNHLSRPFLLSIGNTFRKKGRLFFTLAVFSIGGALFLTAVNVYASMNSSSLGFIKSFRYDISVGLSESYPKSELEKSIRNVPGTNDIEIWAGAKAARIHRDDMTGSSFNIVAIPADTRMVEPIKPENGRWLRPNDTNSIVLNHLVLSLEPDLKVGDAITLDMNGKPVEWKIVGIVTEILSEPKAYVSQSYFQTAVPLTGSYLNAIITADDNSPKSLSVLIPHLQKELEADGYAIAFIKLIGNLQRMVQGHLLLLATMLIIMSILGIVVGGLGLSTAMSVNILERTREIGIMRAIGAPSPAIMRIILGEGAATGLLSWVAASIIAIPFSRYISFTFGSIFFEAPLKTVISLPGILVWLVLSILLAVLSSVYPAKRASKMSVREVLAYE